MRINPKQLEMAMKKMGMQTTQIEAEEVVIRTPGKDIVITDPQVTLMNVMGQKSFQIMGNVQERQKEKFSEEDVTMIMDKTGATQGQARKALAEEGDLASAILKLKK
ncbi:MAG: nascent polypeptide-associated complex protein [Candidatus Aenigmatarchaeota archaeon]